MTATSPARSEFLILSRGQWDEDKSPQEIQAAIDAFYAWHAGLVEQGVAIAGQRLGPEGKVVTRGAILDGPFAEAKEVVGGYWFILASSLDEAAAISSRNPCIACGLQFEVRPLDPEKARADVLGNETPASRR
jgi:hypothetical protein